MSNATLAYLHDLSSSPENAGIPDKLVCDDGWFDTYGYILLTIFAVVDAGVGGEFVLSSEPVNELPSDVDVFNGKLFEFEAAISLLSLLLWSVKMFKVDDDICELINGWNCVYFGSMLSKNDFDIARCETFVKTKWSIECLFKNYFSVSW